MTSEPDLVSLLYHADWRQLSLSAEVSDGSTLLIAPLSGDARVMVGDRPAYRINVARGDALASASLLFPVAVAVVDAELGIMLRLTSIPGR